nr:hypothetical protein [Hydrogenophaga sp.]
MQFIHLELCAGGVGSTDDIAPQAQERLLGQRLADLSGQFGLACILHKMNFMQKNTLRKMFLHRRMN